MGKKKKTETNEQDNLESRRQMLQKIGFALAATTIATNPVEALAQRRGIDALAQRKGEAVPLRGGAKVPSSVQTAVSGDAGELKIFFASNKAGAASILVIRADDKEAVRTAQSQLRAAPATATIQNGVIQVNLSAAAAGRCNLSSKAAAAAIDFGDPPPVATGPITRG